MRLLSLAVRSRIDDAYLSVVFDAGMDHTVLGICVGGSPYEGE
jgi:hypothetical protein